MPRLPIVLVHGYSDKGESFRKWCAELKKLGYDATAIHLANYVSLSNEVTIKDLAEGFDRALRDRAGLSADEPFDAIVHSTGMLVVREWLTTYSGRSARLKHLIGLAPATFGSPMAHKGRSWLGAIFKGGKEPGPDFLEAGTLVLSGLELGSRYTWDLAHKDLLAADQAVYGPTSKTPYPFIFVGLKDYGWLKRAVTEPGTDGTVRWAGVGFNSRKVVVDLTRDPARPGNRDRIQISPWKNSDVPLVLLDGPNHSTILGDPSPELVTMLTEALAVGSRQAYADWAAKYDNSKKPGALPKKAARYQQFVVRAVDERGDGIRDYFLQLGEVANGKFEELPFDLDVHAFGDDPSYRSFHVNLDRLDVDKASSLALRIIATSGSELVGYSGYNSWGGAGGLPGGAAGASEALRKAAAREMGKWDAVIQFDASIQQFTFFYPFTTTLVEIRMNREPMPLTGVTELMKFIPLP